MAGKDLSNRGWIVAWAAIAVASLGTVADAGGYHRGNRCSSGFRGSRGIGHAGFGHAGFGVGHHSGVRSGGFVRGGFGHGGVRLSGSFIRGGSRVSGGVRFGSSYGYGGSCYDASRVYRTHVFPKSYRFGSFRDYGYAPSYGYSVTLPSSYYIDYYGTDAPAWRVSDVAVEPRDNDAITEEDDRAPPARSRSTNPADIERAMQAGIALGRGDKSFQRGDYDDAREEYVRALVLADGDPRGQIALGLAEFARGKFADAARAVRVGVSRAPHLAESSFDLSDAYGVTEDLTAHQTALSEHLVRHPDDADALFLSGFVKFFSGDRAGGAEALEQSRAMSAPESHPTDGDGFIEKAATVARKSTPS
ncbi:MAG: hypothetical protein O7F76_10855 [Planctomycetota bacterium]|nr:hypothetical protein [Planctomycetota bacterium]